MNLVSNLQFEAVSNEVVPCKGVVFRYIESSFRGKNGRFVFSKELRPMKSLSCPGCAQCGYLIDDVQEGLDSPGHIQFDDTLKSGDLVYLSLVPMGHDWETGCLESWYYEVKSAAAEKEGA